MKVAPTIVGEDNFRREVIECRRPVLVEFKADWSGTSHIMAPVIDQVADHCGGRCKVCQIDYDTSERIVKEYGVATLPTILLFEKGNVVARMSEPVSIRVLQERIDAALNKTVTGNGPEGG